MGFGAFFATEPQRCGGDAQRSLGKGSGLTTNGHEWTQINLFFRCGFWEEWGCAGRGLGVIGFCDEHAQGPLLTLTHNFWSLLTSVADVPFIDQFRRHFTREHSRQMFFARKQSSLLTLDADFLAKNVDLRDVGKGEGPSLSMAHAMRGLFNRRQAWCRVSARPPLQVFV